MNGIHLEYAPIGKEAARELAIAASELIAREPGRLAMGMGLSSPKTLHELPAFRPLLDRILGAVTRLLRPNQSVRDICAWANLLDAGEGVGYHNHRASHLGGENALAGSYYFSQCSELVLWLAPHDEEFTSCIKIKPCHGLLAVFDATQMHSVAPSEYSSRLSIAFNVRTS